MNTGDGEAAAATPGDGEASGDGEDAGEANGETTAAGAGAGVGTAGGVGVGAGGALEHATPTISQRPISASRGRANRESRDLTGP